MKSEKRDVLCDRLYKTSRFMAFVQSVNRNYGHLVLAEIALSTNDGLEYVAKHLHVFDVSKKELKHVHCGDVITFDAIAYNYSKLDNDISVFNYSLNGIKNIKIVRVKNGKKKRK